MFWNLGLSSSSTLESLLNRLTTTTNLGSPSPSSSPSPDGGILEHAHSDAASSDGTYGGRQSSAGPHVSVEELLDEQDLLSELKGQNARLIQILSSPSSIASLLHWAAYGMEDIERREQEREIAAREELVRLRARRREVEADSTDSRVQGDPITSSREDHTIPAPQHTAKSISNSETDEITSALEEEKDNMEVIDIGPTVGEGETSTKGDSAPSVSSDLEGTASLNFPVSSKNDIFHTPQSGDDLVPPPSYIPRPATPSSFVQPRDTELERKRNYRYPQIATEILCSDIWSITEGLIKALAGPMKGYWEDVLGRRAEADINLAYEPVPISHGGQGANQVATSPTSSISSSKDRLRESAAREAAYVRFLVERSHSSDALFEEDEKRRELLMGNWARITCLLMAKKPKEVVEFIKSIDGPVERMIRRIDSPPVQDVLLRLVASEEQGVAGVVELLWSQQLIPRLLDLLSPSYPATTHATVSELIKSIIALCAPATFNPNGGDLATQAAQAMQVLSSPLPGPETTSPTENGDGNGSQHQQQQEQSPRPPSPRNNIMVRELVGGRAVITLVGYMVNPEPLADTVPFDDGSGQSAPESEQPFDYRFDPYDAAPLPSVESQSSSLVHSAIIIIELIRKNNPDFSEPSLFHSMRNRLMIMQQKQSEERTPAETDASPEGSAERLETSSSASPEDGHERDREALEIAMQEMSEKMGIVHLGLLLEVLTEQLPAFQEIVRNPRSQAGLRTPGCMEPLTPERFRIIEMYAELLHCSNMALLNRRQGDGPSYSTAGCLEGGLSGLEVLGQALEGDTTGHAGDEEHTDELQPAKELPVSQCGSIDRSVPTSEDGVHALEDRDHLDLDTPAITLNPVGVRLLSNDETDPSAMSESAPSIPPPPSQADEARLRDVMIQDPRIRSLTQRDRGIPSEIASISNIAAASALSVVESDDDSVAAGEAAQDPDYAESDPQVSGGETLKHRLIEQRVLPTIMNLFFEYPNNNFLHNVTYDVVQQILRGRLGPGLNQELIIVLFKEAKMVEKLLDAQRLTDSLLQNKSSSRPAFMGHMMLMAEEICKFFARCSADLLVNIEDAFVSTEWEAFVEGPLKETRLRDTRLLGGTRPQDTMQHPEEGGKTDTDSSDDDDDDTAQAFAGQPLTRAASNISAFNSRFGFGTADHSSGRRDSGQSNSSDEDSDDSGSPRLEPGYGRTTGLAGRDSLEDVFSPASGNAQHIDDDDEAWGDFSGPSGSTSEDPFGDPFEPASDSSPFGISAGGTNRPFTSIDFAERAFADDSLNWDGQDDDSPGIEIPVSEGDSLDHAAAFLAANWSVPGSSLQEGENLPSADYARPLDSPVAVNIPKGRPRSVSVTSAGSPTEQRFNRSRSSSISSSSPESSRKLHPAAALGGGPGTQAISPPDPALMNAASLQEPLGHGVSADTQLREDGMLVRLVEGEEIVVPQDETIRAVHARKLSQG